MDQAAPAHQGFFRHLGKCRQNPNLDPDRRLRARRHHQKALDVPASLYTILQILSMTLFEKTPLDQLLDDIPAKTLDSDISNQINLFNYDCRTEGAVNRSMRSVKLSRTRERRLSATAVREVLAAEGFSTLADAGSTGRPEPGRPQRRGRTPMSATSRSSSPRVQSTRGGGACFCLVSLDHSPRSGCRRFRRSRQPVAQSFELKKAEKVSSASTTNVTLNSAGAGRDPEEQNWRRQLDLEAGENKGVGVPER